MARKFITAVYPATLDLEISLREALPLDHLAHFIVEVHNVFTRAPLHSFLELGLRLPIMPEPDFPDKRG